MVTAHNDSYHWHEMTFFIHQSHSHGGHVTALCFEIPDDPGDEGISTKSSYHESGLQPHTFLKELKAELDIVPAGQKIDWRYMQSLLLPRAINVVDRSVWACTKAIRLIEKSRGKNANARDFFPNAHDLLRHCLHNHENVQVSSKILGAWLHRYEADQRRHARMQHEQQQMELLHLEPLYLISPYQMDTPLPFDAHHDSLYDTVQFLAGLIHRTSSNEIRLRNEIQLAHTVTTTRDTKDMRAVSIVTLIFLPSTFVSTLFSMTFFSQPSIAQPWGVTSKIWIFFVISGILTGITLISWLWSMSKSRRISI